MFNDKQVYKQKCFSRAVGQAWMEACDLQM